MRVDSITEFDGNPAIVSISDVHGHRDRFESALLTLTDHPDFEPVVARADDAETLQWVGGDEYVLVVTGDLTNRGPDSEGCLDLVRRLREQAPAGHVRHLLGNHELYLVYPSPPDWDRWWGGTVTDEQRRAFYDRMVAGDVTVAFGGYEYTYVHAGAPDGVDAETVNENLADAAAVLRDQVGVGDEREAFERVLEDRCPAVYREYDEDNPVREDPDAPAVWLDFSFLRVDSPPQVVGHTPQESVTRNGNVVCQDVILENVDSPGGEAVCVETPDALRTLTRREDGSVSVRRA